MRDSTVIICIKPYVGVHAEQTEDNKFVIKYHNYRLGYRAIRSDVYFKNNHWIPASSSKDIPRCG